MAEQGVVPDNFPRDPCPGLVSGSQPKVLVREIDGRYVAGLTDDELWMRYDACEDLARQLATYTARKMSEFDWSLDETVERVEKSVTRKVHSGIWELSAQEIQWMMRRTRELLSTPSDAKDAPDA